MDIVGPYRSRILREKHSRIALRLRSILHSAAQWTPLYSPVRSELVGNTGYYTVESKNIVISKRHILYPSIFFFELKDLFVMRCIRA